MIARAALLLAGAIFAAAPAMAQPDQAPRPPERPATPESLPPPDRPATAEDPDRPDIRPADAENPAGQDGSEIEDADTTADESEDADAGAAADEGEDITAAQVFGPPMPPHYQALREGDDEYAACLLALSMLGTTYQAQPAISDERNRDCGIARPLHVSRIVPGVELEGGALMRCATARALGFWIRDFVRPAAAALPGAPQLRGLQLGTTYDCRARVGTQDDTGLSEHAFGNAIDIMGFRLEGGADDLPDILPVQPRSGDGDMAEAFQRSVRGAACLWFDTVMGPGSNAAHDDHLHLDVIGRSSLWRLCD